MPGKRGIAKFDALVRPRRLSPWEGEAFAAHGSAAQKRGRP